MGDFLLGVLTTFGVGLFLVVLFFLNPKKAEKWFAIFLNGLSFLGSKFRRRQSKHEIQGGINSFVKHLSRELGVSTVGVKIKWANGKSNDDVLWKDGEVILVLKDRGQRSRNFVHAAYLFTSTSLLKNAKNHLSKKQATAIDLFTTGKIIEGELPTALDYFNKDIANPLLSDEKIKESIIKFQDIDKSGFFINILLQELNYLGSKVIFNKHKQGVYEEVSHLINFLEKFATRELGDVTVSDEFVGKFLKCSIKIVSSRAVREVGRAEGPSERVGRAFERGIENVYVIGPYEGDGRGFIDKVCGTVCIKDKNVEVSCKKSFKGVVTVGGQTRPVKTYMKKLENRSNRRFIETDDVHEQIEQYRNEART